MDEIAKIEVPYIPQDYCRIASKYLKERNPDKIFSLLSTHMCIGGTNIEQICKADIGSPAMGFAELENDTRLFLHGIITKGNTCSQNVPFVLTRVSEYVSWISEHTSE